MEGKTILARMTLSSGKRAWIAVAVLVVILCGCGAAYFYYRSHMAALPASTVKVTPQQVDLLSLLPGDAPLIGFGDLAALKNSAFVQEFEKLGPSPAEDPDYSAFVRETGFDYARDLDSVAIAAWPDFSSTQPVAPGGPAVPAFRVLVLGDGRFDAAKIAAYAARSGQTTNVNGKTVYEFRGATAKDSLYVSLLSPGRIALGHGGNLGAVLGAKAAAAQPGRAVHLARVAGRPIYIIARLDNLLKDMSIDLGSFDQLRALLAGLRWVTIAGQPNGANFEVGAEGDCDSASHALQISTILGGMRWFARSALAAPGNQQQMTKDQVALANYFLQATKVSNDGHWLELKVALTPAVLRLMLPPETAPRKPR
jgi:hypothetical protein